MKKIIILLPLIGLFQIQISLAQLVVFTKVNDHNISILLNQSIHKQYDPQQFELESACHPSPHFIENSNIQERIFYINNTESKEIVVTINQINYNLNNETTLIYTHKYETCSIGWQVIDISFNNISISYIRLCEPIIIPLHPLFILLLSAFTLLAIGSIYGQSNLVLFGESQQESIGMKQAISFIFVASLGLMSLYYLKNYITILLLIWVLLVGFFAIYKILCDIFAKITKFGKNKIYSIPIAGQISQQMLIAGFVSLIIVISYMFTRQWFLSNIIAASIILLMFQIIEVDSLKTATVLLLLAFFYDIFWVFYSNIFFGESVMASVATSIDLPMKLQCPELFSHTLPLARCSLLGLGDIILPGVLVKYLYKFNKKIFVVGYIGYMVGLILCIFCLIKYQLAQPALLYIVPCLLIPIIVESKRNNQLKRIWLGQISNKNDLKINRIEQIDQDYELAAGEI